MATKIEQRFRAQLDDDDELDEIKQLFAESYGYALADTRDDEPPIEHALRMVNEEHDLDVPATAELVKPWIDELKPEIELGRLGALHSIRQESALRTFKERRGRGDTFTKAIKATGEDPQYMIRVLGQAEEWRLSPDDLAVLRQARQEEHETKAYRARAKVYRLLGQKVEDALAAADFSTVPPDRLADLMLKIAQVSREDAPPENSIRLSYSRNL